MNRLPYSIIIILLILIPKQICSSPLTHWGVKTGYTSARQIWKHDWIHQDKISWRSGINIGLFTEWFDHKGLSLLTEIKYEQKGMGYPIGIVTPQGLLIPDARIMYSRLDYVSIPILAKYTFHGNPISTYVLLGQRLDFLISYADDRDHLYWGIEDEFNSFVYGLTVGFGFQNDTWISRRLSLELTYNHDLTKQDEFTHLVTENRQSIRNETFNISLCVGL